MNHFLSRSKIPQICGALTILLSAVCLFGWYTNNMMFATFNTHLIMMAPSTGISFCLLGIALLGHVFLKTDSRYYPLLKLFILLPAAISIFELISFFAGFDSIVDRFLTGMPGDGLSFSP